MLLNIHTQELAVLKYKRKLITTANTHELLHLIHLNDMKQRHEEFSLFSLNNYRISGDVLTTSSNAFES